MMPSVSDRDSSETANNIYSGVVQNGSHRSKIREHDRKTKGRGINKYHEQITLCHGGRDKERASEQQRRRPRTREDVANENPSIDVNDFVKSTIVATDVTTTTALARHSWRWRKPTPSECVLWNKAATRAGIPLARQWCKATNKDPTMTPAGQDRRTQDYRSQNATRNKNDTFETLGSWRNGKSTESHAGNSQGLDMLGEQPCTVEEESEQRATRRNFAALT